MFYNALLAIINAHVMFIDQGMVLLIEGAILAVGCAYLIIKFSTIYKYIPFIAVSLIVYILLFIVVSVVSDGHFFKSLGDMVIIFVFYLLGTMVTRQQLIKSFYYIVAVVVGVMVLEGWFLDAYVTVFQPALYYANTRDTAQFTMDSTGLFRNSLGFAGRFSYDLFGERRISSIFLEQVSLANFSMVLSIFTMTFWQKITRWQKVYFSTAIMFMIVSNSSRIGTILCILMLIGYSGFAKLPRYSFWVIMPVVLLLSFVFFNNGDSAEIISADDASGRIGHTVAMLSAIDWKDFLMGNVEKTSTAGDSGYAYVIYSQTIFGLIYFWFFLAKILPSRTDVERRFAVATTIYIVSNLLVGAAIFSIKVAAPLWLLGGYLVAHTERKEVPRVAHVKLR